MRRTDVVAQVGAVKANGGSNGDVIIRPGREAEILRRLVARHQRPVSEGATLVRHLARADAATCCRRRALLVAVYVPDARAAAIWDLARDHFGSLHAG